MDVTIDVRDEEEHQEWVELCETVSKRVDSVDGLLVMTSEAHFYFDAVSVTGVTVSDEIDTVLKDEGYDDVVVSVSGFSHLEDIADHMNTKEIRVQNSVTE